MQLVPSVSSNDTSKFWTKEDENNSSDPQVSLGVYTTVVRLKSLIATLCWVHWVNVLEHTICNSHTMGCPPVRGDNPRALASGLQVNKHGLTILYHLHQCRPCTSRDISC